LRRIELVRPGTERLRAQLRLVLQAQRADHAADHVVLGEQRRQVWIRLRRLDHDGQRTGRREPVATEQWNELAAGAHHVGEVVDDVLRGERGAVGELHARTELQLQLGVVVADIPP